MDYYNAKLMIGGMTGAAAHVLGLLSFHAQRAVLFAGERTGFLLRVLPLAADLF